MKFHHSCVLKADRATIIDTLSDVRGFQRNVPWLADWLARDGTLSGQARIATVPALGVFACAVTVVRSTSITHPGVIRLSGTQRDGPIRWKATMEIAVADAGPGAVRMDVTADIRVSGAGHAINSGDVHKALQAAVSSLDEVGQAENGRREDPKRQERHTNSSPAACAGANVPRASTCSMSRVGDRRRGPVLLAVGIALGILVGRAFSRATRVVPRENTRLVPR